MPSDSKAPVALLFVLLGFAATAAGQDVATEFIIEFEYGTLGSSIGLARAQAASRAAAIASLASEASSVFLAKNVPHSHFAALTVFPGVGLRVAKADLPAFFEALKVLPNFKAVHASHIYAAPDPVQTPGAVPQLIGTDTNTGVTFARTKFNSTGKGVKVGIIDSGVDYLHPALGGCFGKGCKVFTGYDFVGDKYNPLDKVPIIKPDKDPMSRCLGGGGHGTHVAGIVAARAAKSPFGPFTGVAPDVQIGAYKIFGCPPIGVSTVIIVQAVERAYNDKMDIINLSLGFDGASSYAPDIVLQSLLGSLGLMVFKAAGNAGQTLGLFAGGYGGPNLFSVASLDNWKSAERHSKITISAPRLTALVLDPLLSSDVKTGPAKLGGLPVIPTGKKHPLVVATPPDACTKLTNKNLKGAWAVIQRGTCTSVTKADAAQAAGAAGVIIINNVPGSFTIGAWAIPFLAISQADGVKLSVFLTKAKAVATITNTGPIRHLVLDDPNGGKASGFTSWGPSDRLDLTPTLAGMGSKIYSTTPNNTFDSFSGTSMSSPFASGCAALWLEAFKSPVWQKGHLGKALSKKGRYKALSTALISTSSPIRTDQPGVADSVYRVGAGQVHIDSAIRNTVTVDQPPRAFISVPNGLASYTTSVVVKNHGTTAVVYQLSSIHGQSVRAVDLWWAKTPVLSSFKATVVIAGPPLITVLPGAAKTIKVSFKIPKRSRFLYSGYIQLTVAKGSKALADGLPPPSLSIPYIGYSDDGCKLPVLSEPKIGASAAEKKRFSVYARRLWSCNGAGSCSVYNDIHGGPVPTRISLSDQKLGTVFPLLIVSFGRTTGPGGFKMSILDSKKRFVGVAFDTKNFAGVRAIAGNDNADSYKVEWDLTYTTALGVVKTLTPGLYTLIIAADVPQPATRTGVCPAEEASVLGGLIVTD